jgi:exodeoxyribonuclease VII small subunit
MTFEEDLARLEAIASELDRDGVTLDEALKLFEEGVTRLRRASAALSKAEAQVAVLVEQIDGAFTLRPLPQEDQGGGRSAGSRQQSRG